MLDRLSLQSDMARFRLYAGTEVDLSSDARLTERRVRAEPLWSEANLSQSKSIDTSVVEESAKVDNVVEKKMNEKVDTKLDEMVDTKTDDTMKERIDTKPLEKEEKREQSMVSEPMDLDEEEMMRLVNESVREAVASREPSPKPSPITPSLNVPEASPASIPAEPVSQPAVPANSAVAPAEVVTREKPVSSPVTPLEAPVSQFVTEAASPVATPNPSKPLMASSAEESVSSPANVSASQVFPANPTQGTSLIADSDPFTAPAELLSSSAHEGSPQPNEDSLEFADLTASMIDSIPLAPVLSASTVERSIMSRSAVKSSFDQLGRSPVDRNPVGESLVDRAGDEVCVELTVNQPMVNQPAVNQPTVNQPIVNQPIVNQPTVNQPMVNQPTVHQPIVNQPMVNQPIVNQPMVNQPIVNQSPVNQSSVNQPAITQPAITPESRPSITRRRRRTFQPAIAVEVQTTSVEANTEPVTRPSELESDISVEPAELMKAIDALQPAHVEPTQPADPSARPSVLSSLSTDSVNEAALERAMEVAMETVDSAPHLLKPAENHVVSPTRTNKQPSEIRRVSIGISPAPIQLIRRSSATRPSTEQSPIQPSCSTAIKHISARRVSLQPTPPPPRDVPPPPPLGMIRRSRPSLVRPSKEMASSHNFSERGQQGKVGPSLWEVLLSNHL